MILKFSDLMKRVISFNNSIKPLKYPAELTQDLISYKIEKFIQSLDKIRFQILLTGLRAFNGK